LVKRIEARRLRYSGDIKLNNASKLKKLMKLTKIMQKISIKCAGDWDNNDTGLSRRHDPLRTIHLISSSYDMTGRGLKHLGHGFQRVKSLKDVCIEFSRWGSDPKITNRGVGSVCRSLRKISFLESLNIDFQSSPIDDAGMNKISKFLKNRIFLKNLCFSFTKY